MTATAHPFEMHTAIHSEPREISRLVNDDVRLERFARELHATTPLTLVGIGSSLHAAQLGASLWRELVPARPIRVFHAFDFVSDPSLVGEIGSHETVIAFSHRGTKTYTREALAIAQARRAKTCVVTGQGAEAVESADTHIETVPQESSSAHTASLVGSLAIMVRLVELISGLSSNAISTDMVRVTRNALEQEERIQGLVGEVARGIRHIWLVGTGSDVIVARETALKIKETSYIPAEGMSVEEMLHGPFQCVEPNDLMILIDTQGTATSRLETLHHMAEVVGVPTIKVATRDDTASRDAEQTISTAASSYRAIRSVGALVVLQLFSYHLAVNRGENPDNFRLHDPRFKRASSIVKL